MGLFIGMSTQFVSLNIPTWRIPNLEQVRAMTPAVRRQGRLDRDPFVATYLLAEKHKDMTF